MNDKKIPWIVATLTAIAPAPAMAQTLEPLDGVRLVEVQVEPERPQLGQAFELRVTLRLRPSAIAVLPDTLPPGDGVYSVGTGNWGEAPALGDSTEIRIVYPLIGFREGELLLPRLELWLRTSTDPLGLGSATASASDPSGAQTSEIERRVFDLGSLTVEPFAAFAAPDVLLQPRGAADVLGRDRSLWWILAVSLGGLGLIALVVDLAPRWWRQTGAAWVARLRGRSPKQQALKELERIRRSGFHKDGRIDEFYASSTDTLRTFAERIEPTWSVTLTSTELMARLRERWGADGLDGLPAAIDVAERVKFAAYQPDHEAAEQDWRTIHDWVRDAPER